MVDRLDGLPAKLALPRQQAAGVRVRVGRFALSGFDQHSIMTGIPLRIASIIGLALAAACSSGDASPRSSPASGVIATPRGSEASEAVAAPQLVVDSARPMADLIERFQHGLPIAERMENGEPSKEALVRAFFTALYRRDTTVVAKLFITRAEFAYLYFPSSRLSRPPYEIDPAFAWFQLSSDSEQGVRKALERLGGRRMKYLGFSCGPDPVDEGAVRSWQSCVVRWRNPGGEEFEAALFGSIIERDGRFKFFSYTNDL